MFKGVGAARHMHGVLVAALWKCLACCCENITKDDIIAPARA